MIISISSIISCLMYLLCINNKDDDDDGLGISSSCRKIPKIGYLLYAGGSDIYILLLIIRSLNWHLLILAKLTRWQWWLLWSCAVVTKTTNPETPFHRPRDPVFSTDPGTPQPGPVLSTKINDHSGQRYMTTSIIQSYKLDRTILAH